MRRLGPVELTLKAASVRGRELVRDRSRRRRWAHAALHEAATVPRASIWRHLHGALGWRTTGEHHPVAATKVES